MQREEQWDHTEGRWRLRREKGQLVQPLWGEAAVGAGEPYTRCGSYQGQRGCEGRSASPICIFCPRGCGAGHGLGGPGWKQESPRGELRLATLR